MQRSACFVTVIGSGTVQSFGVTSMAFVTHGTTVIQSPPNLKYISVWCASNEDVLGVTRTVSATQVATSPDCMVPPRRARANCWARHCH
eukprot:4206150-Prymnesium_polylepis.2